MWRGGPTSPGAHLISRLLERHGVAALIWSAGSVPWANAAALDLIAEDSLREDGSSRRRRLAEAIRDTSALHTVAPGEEPHPDLDVSSTRPLLTLSPMALRSQHPSPTAAHSTSPAHTIRCAQGK